MERAELRRLVVGTGCAVERSGAIFLVDPAWPEAERAAAEGIMLERARGSQADGWLGVRTGGSGGVVKFARHDERTLAAAVRGFCAHFRLERVNAIDVLPAHHVSGLMARVRSAATGGKHVAWAWKRLEAGEVPPLAGDDAVLSLVPTQLQRLMAMPTLVAWLRELRMIFIGGGPLWRDLADRAADAGLRLVISYGMTETAAMIAAQAPEDFLAGDRSCGRVLPHARVAIAPDGTLCVGGESLFRGYWPGHSDAREFQTEDLGAWDAQGRLQVLGRRDAMIITGGKKVRPDEVEAALRASGEFHDVAVIGVPDPEWGERVVACYPMTSGKEPDLAQAVTALAAHQRPKQFFPIVEWPRTPQGKLNRAWLRDRVLEQQGDGHA